MWDDGTILAGAAEGKLALRGCANCQHICHPPLPMCPHCQATVWEERPVSGRARLHSWLVSIRPDGAVEAPRIVIVADLEEGVRFVSNLVDALIADLSEGMALELCFRPEGDVTLPRFRPAEQA